MKRWEQSRREFLKTAAMAAGVAVLPSPSNFARASAVERNGSSSPPQNAIPPDYTLHIKVSPIEIAPNRLLSTTTYNGQFPGPLLRLKEGREVTIDIYNDNRYAGAVALARTEDFSRRRRSFRGGHAVDRRARQTTNLIHAAAGRVALLPHA